MIEHGQSGVYLPVGVHEASARSVGRELPAVAALVLVAASALPVKRGLLDLVDHATVLTITEDADLLFYLAPPYAALVLFAVLQVGPSSWRRALETCACIVAVAAALVHTYGLARLVDRTPRDFPWVFMTALGVTALVAIATSIAVARRARGARRSGYVISAYVALLAPLSVGYLWVADDRYAAFYLAHGAGWIGLAVLAIVAIRRGSDVPGNDFGPVAALVGRSAVALVVLLASAAVPLWPRTSGGTAMEPGGCTLYCETVLGPLWDALDSDPDCRTDDGRLVTTAVAIGLVQVLVFGLWIWRTIAAARAGAPALRPRPCGRTR